MRALLVPVLFALLHLPVAQACPTNVPPLISPICWISPCNFLCCPCNRSGKRSISEADETALLRFKSVDYNGDGLISKEEGYHFLMNAPLRVKSEIGKGDWFATMDTNGDGYIQPKEFDDTLA